MVAMFLFTDWFPRAFDSVLWPVLGFVFMPYTTLAWMAGELHGGVQGGWVVLVVFAVIADLSHMGGGGHHYRSYRSRR
jgi:hypothetical protein